MKLPELEQSLLRAARESLTPSLDDRERHEAALLTRLEGATPSSPRLRGLGRAAARGALPSGTLPQVAPRVVGGRLELVSMGLAIGVVLGGVVGFALGRGVGAPSSFVGPAASGEVEGAGLRASAADVEARAVASAPIDPVESEPTGLADHAEAAPDRAARSEPSSLDGEARAHQRTRVKPGAKKAPRSKSSLAIELAMLQRARRALNADNGLLALGIVQELDERFPRGVLIEERTATRVLSLCLLGRTDEARHFGSEFLMQHPSSVYAERVRASCAH